MKITFRFIIDCIVVVLLGILHSLSYEIFIFSNQFAPSGINGIATMIQYKLGFSVGYMSLIINIPLCVAAFFLCDKEYAIKSFLFSVAFSVALLVWKGSKVLEPFIYETHISPLLAPIAGGAITGFVTALNMRINSSTGGTDVIARLYHHYKPNSSIVHVIFILNVCVAVSSYFVYDFAMDPVILCILYSFVSVMVSDNMLKADKSAVKVEIITKSAEEISDEIIKTLHHSVTEVNARGMYSHTDLQMLVCIINKHQLADLERLLSKYPDTFSFVSRVNQTIGNFKHIKGK